MWMAKMMRIIRSKITLSILLSMALIYALAIMLWNSDYNLPDDIDTSPLKRPQQIRWDRQEEANDSSVVSTCRNSVQGKYLLADDRGYVCQRIELLRNGCCNTESEGTRRYSCDTCNHHGCCAIYEYCVSCCLHPNKTRILKRMLNKMVNASPVYVSVSDHFELCLVKCRTSSQSVLHETHYKDSKAKHCYLEGSSLRKANPA